MIRYDRIPNVALLAVSPIANLNDDPTAPTVVAAAVAAAINADLCGPWRMWVAGKGPLHILDPRR